MNKHDLEHLAYTLTELYFNALDCCESVESVKKFRELVDIDYWLAHKIIIEKQVDNDLKEVYSNDR